MRSHVGRGRIGVLINFILIGFFLVGIVGIIALPLLLVGPDVLPEKKETHPRTALPRFEPDKKAEREKQYNERNDANDNQ